MKAHNHDRRRAQETHMIADALGEPRGMYIRECHMCLDVCVCDFAWISYPFKNLNLGHRRRGARGPQKIDHHLSPYHHSTSAQHPYETQAKDERRNRERDMRNENPLK